MTNMETILVVNAGSSSLKFQVFGLGILPDLKYLVKGQRPDSRVALARGLVSENVARRRFAS